MAKKKVSLIDTINMGIFPHTALISFGYTYPELIEELEKQKGYDWIEGLEQVKKEIIGGDFDAIAIEATLTSKKYQGKELYYIYFPEPFVFSDNNYCVLAHEILHICQFYLRKRLDRTREFECEAYLHTHLMKQCLKILRGT